MLHVFILVMSQANNGICTCFNKNNANCLHPTKRQSLTLIGSTPATCDDTSTLVTLPGAVSCIGMK